MALIANQKKGRTDGGYTRLFGNEILGSLISQVQAAVISSGSELEKIILEFAKDKICDALTLEDFLDNKLQSGTFIITKKLFKERLKDLLNTTNEPDFMIIFIDDNNIFILELKDGDTFDTKKVAGEVKSLKETKRLLQTFLKRKKIKPKNANQYEILLKFVSFNQDDKQRIILGLKNLITEDMAMTGREFCDVLKISFEDILALRKKDQQDNIRFFKEQIQKAFDEI